MKEVFDFIWNLVVVVVTGGFFLIAVGTMIKVMLMLIYFLMPYVIYPFSKFEESDNAKGTALIVSTILALPLFLIVIFIAAKVIGNGVLFIFFFVGLYFMFRSYRQNKEKNQN